MTFFVIDKTARVLTISVDNLCIYKDILLFNNRQYAIFTVSRLLYSLLKMRGGGFIEG